MYKKCVDVSENTISLFKSTNVLLSFIYFKLVSSLYMKQIFLKNENLKQINNKWSLANLYKDIVLSDPSTHFMYNVVYQQHIKILKVKMHANQIYLDYFYVGFVRVVTI